MAKAGDAYQAAVAEVMLQIDPAARIEVGEWIEGPDGERDCDVGVYPTTGSCKFIYIECKDRKRPVGIEFLDALESKRRDVNVDIAILCSNSGFTADALRKAARVGILALSALIEGDSHIRVQVEEEIYTQKIRAGDCQISFDFVENRPEFENMGFTARDVLHDGRPVAAWVRDRCTALVGMTARSCTIVSRYKFWRSLQFHFREEIAAVGSMTLKIPCDVQWCSQIVRLSASSGMYDYLRHSILLGKGQQQLHIHNVAYDRWVPIDFVPQGLHHELTPPRGGTTEGLALISGIDDVGGAPAPDIDPFVESEEIERIDSQGATHKIERNYAERHEKAAALKENRPRSSAVTGQVREADARESRATFSIATPITEKDVPKK